VNARARLSAFLLDAYFFVRRLPVRRLLNAYTESQWWPAERHHDQAGVRLRRVIAAAARNPFYEQRFRDHGVGPQDLRNVTDLSRFPVLEKADLHALRASLPSGIRGEVRKTAGTSGFPVEVVASSSAQAASLAARYRCYAWYGLAPGEREARFWGRPIERLTPVSQLRRWILNRELFDYRHVSAQTAAESHARLVQRRVSYAYGYASLLMRLCRQVERQGLAAPQFLRAVVSTAETASAADREWMAGVLGCPVVDEYGCSETDIISFSCPAGGRHLMAENVYVEEAPQRDAEGLSELIVTDLHNETMPLIRYRLGDAVSLKQGTCECGRGLPLLSEVRGRTQDRYVRTPTGDVVHSNHFSSFIQQKQAAGYPIRQFQVVQTALDEVEVRLVMDQVKDRGAEVAARLVELTERYYGPGVHCRVHWVEEIVPEPGQKYDYFVSRLDREADWRA